MPVEDGREVQMILASQDRQEQIKYYLALLERVGPVEAQEQLYRAGLPFTGETHLLNHTAGDYLYEKHGLEGITYCRDYFLESCYHGLLLRVISGKANDDMDSIKRIMDHCQQAGVAVPSQCAHGIGHGYVAAVGYAQLVTALEQCDAIGAQIANFPLFNCHDGAFMENVFGVHEGKPSPDRWVKEDDDFYPCNDPRLRTQHINPCWSNQPALLFQRRHGNLAQVGEICLKVSPEGAQRTCFDGLSRQINPLTENKMEKVFSLCGQLPPEWQQFCYQVNVGASFSLGDRTMPYKVCAQLKDPAKTECYQVLFARISVYAKDSQDKQGLCERIHAQDAGQRQSCREF